MSRFLKWNGVVWWPKGIKVPLAQVKTHKESEGRKNREHFETIRRKRMLPHPKHQTFTEVFRTIFKKNPSTILGIKFLFDSNFL